MRVSLKINRLTKIVLWKKPNEVFFSPFRSSHLLPSVLQCVDLISKKKVNCRYEVII